MTDDYPLSPKYPIERIDKVDALYDKMPLSEISEQEDIPKATLKDWRDKGYISTTTNHMSQANRKWSDETIERADLLCDRMPLKSVSDILGVPYETLRNWVEYGWISTDRDHRAACASKPKQNERRAHRAAYLVHEKGYLQREAAERMGVSQSTISRLLKMWRRKTFVLPGNA